MTRFLEIKSVSDTDEVLPPSLENFVDNLLKTHMKKRFVGEDIHMWDVHKKELHAMKETFALMGASINRN